MKEADVKEYMEKKYGALQMWNEDVLSFTNGSQIFLVENHKQSAPVVYGFIETIEEADQPDKKGKK